METTQENFDNASETEFNKNGFVHLSGKIRILFDENRVLGIGGKRIF